MAFDLAISENFDLVITGARDLAGVSGDELIAQRIVIRLRVIRGSWVLDDSNSLGSNINEVMSRSMADAEVKLPTLIRQALTDIDEVEIVNVEIIPVSTKQVLATIFFQYRPDLDAMGDAVSGDVQDITVPLTIGGE